MKNSRLSFPDWSLSMSQLPGSLGTPVLVLSKEIQILGTIRPLQHGVLPQLIYPASPCLKLHIDMGRRLPDPKSLISVTLQFCHGLCDSI